MEELVVITSLNTEMFNDADDIPQLSYPEEPRFYYLSAMDVDEVKDLSKHYAEIADQLADNRWFFIFNRDATSEDEIEQAIRDHMHIN
jgi:hypothetical protein